jgi:hypothetical protein
LTNKNNFEKMSSLFKFPDFKLSNENLWFKKPNFNDECLIEEEEEIKQKYLELYPKTSEKIQKDSITSTNLSDEVDVSEISENEEEEEEEVTDESEFEIGIFEGQQNN